MTDRREFADIMNRNAGAAGSAATYDAAEFLDGPDESRGAALRRWCTQLLRMQGAMALIAQSDATIWDGERDKFVLEKPTEAEVDALFGEMVGKLAKFVEANRPKAKPVENPPGMWSKVGTEMWRHQCPRYGMVEIRTDCACQCGASWTEPKASAAKAWPKLPDSTAVPGVFAPTRGIRVSCQQCLGAGYSVCGTTCVACAGKGYW